MKSFLDNIINSSRIFIFIKGTPDEPKCGFTTKTLNALNKINMEFSYMDVTVNPHLLVWLKVFYGHPSFP